MILRGGTVYDGQFCPRKTDLATDGPYIAKVGQAEDIYGDVLDCEGCVVVPGFVDAHIHGCGGGDMADASVQSLERMSRFLADHGVTSFCPTSMTLPEDVLRRQYAAVEQLKGKECGAYVQGVRMEGPFLSMSKKGAQCGDYIQKPSFDTFLRLYAVSPIAVVDVAPEEEGALAFSKQASAYCTVSMGHTAATLHEAETALQNGFSHGTHLFNAMTPIGTREPGVAVALLESDFATAELICDGFHVHPAMIRMAFRMLSEDRVVVVSDAMAAAGCADGVYTLGGQQVLVRDGKATLPDGTIAASTTNIYREFLNLLTFGIPFPAALKACTINPARVIRADRRTGSLEEGKLADILVLNEDFSIRHIFIKGKQYK